MRCLSESYVYVNRETKLTVTKDSANYVVIKDQAGSFSLILPDEKYEELKKLINLI